MMKTKRLTTEHIPRQPRRLRGQYYQNSPYISTATDIVVGVSATIGGIDVTLDIKSRITGTVTGPDGVTPLQGIRVTAYYRNDDEVGSFSSFYTDSQGVYTIKDLDAGSYHIHFHDPIGTHLSEYYDDAPDIDSSTEVAVSTSSLVGGVNASLAIAATITGRVTAEHDSSPLEEISVNLFKWNENAGYWSDSGHTQTDGDGTYALKGLEQGTYRIGFFDPYETYQYEYHRNGRELGFAADIHISPLAPAVVDASLTRTDAVTPEVVGMTRDNPAGDPGALTLSLYGGVGQRYQLQGSTNLVDWNDIGEPVTVEYDYKRVPVQATEQKQFWRFKSVP